MTINELLENGIRKLKEYNIDESNLKAKILLSYCLNKPKEFLISNRDMVVEKEVENTFFDGIKKLINNVPIQYITNKQEFMKLDFYVDDNVLIPRADTEILVEEVINIGKSGDKILDLCTGSGAIGISLAKYIENCEVFASDISKKALEIAEKNAINNCCKINFIESDLFENINAKEFDIIVSNPPYIETDVIYELDCQVKKEPMIALDGGVDGLDFYRKIVKDAKYYLKSGGYLCLEIGYNQREAVEKILNNNNYIDIYSKKDLANNDRVIVGRFYN